MQQDMASATAYTVLQGLLLTANNPSYKDLVSADTKTACQQILSASTEGQKRLRQLDSRLFKLFAPLIEKILMPGITLHYALRKRFIEDATRQAITQGVTQVVNLGAGFDTLAWRLHAEHPQINFIELDHPATNEQKAKAFFSQSPKNFHLLAVDFSQTNARQALEAFPAFDADRPTLFICEGVLMYLNQSDVIDLFEGIRQLSGTGTRFVFTCVGPLENENNNTGRLLKLYLKFKNEPLNWSLTEDKLPNFLQDQRYELKDMAASDELRSRYLKDIQHGTLHRGEYLALAIAN